MLSQVNLKTAFQFYLYLSIYYCVPLHVAEAGFHFVALQHHVQKDFN